MMVDKPAKELRVAYGSSVWSSRLHSGEILSPGRLVSPPKWVRKPEWGGFALQWRIAWLNSRRGESGLKQKPAAVGNEKTVRC